VKIMLQQTLILFPFEIGLNALNEINEFLSRHG